MKSKKKKPAPAPRPLVIVDDEKSYTELLSGLLEENLGRKVHAFTRPTDALGFLEKQPAGVVVTDYFMPEMDGIEFIRRAGRAAPDAAFILISGHNLDPMEHELSKLRVLKGRIQKPFGWKVLADMVLEAWPGPDCPQLVTTGA